MSEPKLSYLGPLDERGEVRPVRRPIWERLPIGFLLIVCLPTLIAAIYFLLVATPRYVSEARFIVRAPSQNQPSSLGVALQGVGIPTSQTDAFAVHEYISSRDALRELNRKVDVATVYSGRFADPFSSLPRPWQGRSFEDTYQGFKDFVTVGYDATTGISTLRVEAFRPGDAERIANVLLEGGEALVNRLNMRAQADAISNAERNVSEAQERLSLTQDKLSAYRNRERFIDPTQTAKIGSELIGELAIRVATLRAERAQIATDAPNSPQLPIIDSRIQAFQQQISQEQAKLAGDTSSLAAKIGEYAQLELEQQFADKALTSATQGLETARLDARRKMLYLDRVVNPNLPDLPTEPHRWMAILAVLGSALLAYGTGWLIWSGVRESRQD